MRTSKRVTLDVNTVQQFFALFRDHRGTRILFQSLDLELHCDPENLKVVEVLHQLLNACVRKVSCERVDWDQRDEPAREIGEEFAPGQLVQLRSGGPRMTVVRVGTSVEVSWFDASHTLQTASFHPWLLLADTRSSW